MGNRKSLTKMLAVSMIATILSSSLGISSASAAVDDVQIAITPTPNVDVVLTVGNTTWDATNFSSDLKARLQARGISTDKVNVTSVEQKEVSAKNTFAWQRYTHVYTDSAYSGATGDGIYTRDHIVSNGSNLTFYGYDAPGYRDFMIMDDQSVGKKTFTFDLNEAGINYHSMEGGGFLFNTKVDASGMLTGYSLMYESGGIGLYQITGVNVNSFHDSANGGMSAAGGVTKINTFSKPYGAQHAVKIEVTQTALNMWDNGAQVANNYPIPTIYGNGFGPIASYNSHGCNMLSFFTFNNLQMTTINAKQFKEVIRQPSWRADAKHFVANLDDKTVSDFDNPEFSGEILSRLTNAEIAYAALGTTANQAQAQAFITRNNGNGTFINNGNYASAVDQLAGYIYGIVNVGNTAGDPRYVLVGEPTNINVIPASLATNSQTELFPQGRWRIDHDYNYFENGQGQASWAGQWQKDLLMIFDKPGKYEVWFGDKHPSPRFIIAHRRPVASFNMTITPGPSAYTVTTTDRSYDLDGMSQPDRGIAKVEWSWKEATAVNWTAGQIPSSLPTGKAYVIQIRALDKQGVWSRYESRYITTYPTATKPVASYEMPLQATKYDIVPIMDSSYDPGGKGIVERVWKISKTGNVVYTGADPVTSFRTFGIGKYDISLKVRNGSNLWSDEYSSTINITADTTIPDATFDLTRKDYTNQDIGFTITFNDAGGSEFAAQRYAVTQSVAFPTSGFTAWDSNPAPYVSITQEGRWFIHVEAKDNEGNIMQRSMGEYQIDKTPPAAPTLVPSKTVPTNQDVSVTIGYPADATQKQYQIDGGIWNDYTNPVYMNKNGVISAKSTDAAGNVSTVATLNVANIDKIPPLPVNFSAPQTPTAGNVPVTVIYPSDAVVKEFKIGLDGIYAPYTGPVVMSSNGSVYARSKDAAGNISGEIGYIVKNIDRSAPAPATLVADKTAPTNTDVTVTISYPANVDVPEYRLGSTNTWDVYLKPIVLSANDVVFARGKNFVGNYSPEASLTVNNIKKTAPVPPSIVPSTTDTTAGNVTVTITYPADAVKKQYQFEGDTTWIDYTGPIVVTDNKTILARAIDVVGNISTSGSLPVTNIKKTPPADAIFDTPGNSGGAPTNKDVEVVINFPPDAVVKEYQLGGTNGPWLPYTGSITVGENTTVYVRSKDAAGNQSNVGSLVISNIDKTPPAGATFTPQKTEPTSQSFAVVINYPADAVIREYKLSTPGSDWGFFYGQVVVSDNVTISARSRDAAGNESVITTYNVTNFVKNTQTNPPVLKPSSNVPTNQDVIVNVDYPAGSVTTKYRIDGGPWMDYKGPITMIQNGVIEVQSTDAAGNVSPIGRIVVSNINKVKPADATFSVDRSGPTNGDVRVSIGYPYNAVVREYKIGDGPWLPYSSAVVLSENTTVYARSTDALGNVSKETSYGVTNIDRTPPAPPSIVADNTNPTNGNVNVTITYPVGTVLKEYQLGNGPWLSYTGPIPVTGNTVVNARATDAAGNVSTSGSLPIENITKTTPTETVVIKPGNGDNTPTAGPVLVEIDWPSNAVVKQCRINNGPWFDYVGPISMTDNGTVTCRYQDAAGNWSAEFSKTISNIVKTVLGAPTLYANNATIQTNENVIVTITYPSGSTTEQYRVDGGEWQTYLKPVVMTANGTVEARGINAAGTISPSGNYTVSNISKVGPGGAVITANITEPTSGKVVITINYPAGVSLREYHIGETGEKWIVYSGPFEVDHNLKVFARSRDELGNISTVVTYMVNNINTASPNQPILIPDVVAITNSDVKVTINYASASATKEYRIDQGAWQVYSGPVTMTTNGVIEARETSSAGVVSGVSRLDVLNIDKTSPADATLTPDKTATATAVTITISFPADAVTKQYRVGETGSFLPYTGPIVVTANAKVYAKSQDAVGNWSNVTNYNVTNIAAGLPAVPTFKATPEGPTNGTVMVTITFPSEVTWKQYRVNGGTWQNYYGSVSMTANGTVEAKGTNGVGVASDIGTFQVTNISTAVLTSPTLTPDKTAITNGNVNVTVVYPSTAFLKQYRLGDTGTWVNYYSPIAVTDNIKVYARYQDSNGLWSAEASYSVANIDKVVPNTPALSANTYAATSSSVIVTVSYPSDSVNNEYKVDSGAWTKYTGPITVASNGTVSARATDAAGGVSQVGTLTVSNITKDSTSGTTFVPDVTAPTNGNVRVTINFASDAVTKNYRIGPSGAWQNYYYAVLVDSNTTISARSQNAVGVWTDIASYNITNIFKNPPAAVKLTPDTTGYTNKNVTLTLTSSEGAIIEYQIGSTSGVWKVYTAPVVVTDNGSTVYARAKNQVGIASGITNYTVANIDRIAPNAPYIYASTYGKTTMPVTITYYAPAGTVNPEYRIGETGQWTAFPPAGFQVKTNGKVYVRVYDQAGNVSPVTEYNVTNITM